jgi:LAO/AO transport system kinase
MPSVITSTISYPDYKILARTISLVENEGLASSSLLSSLKINFNIPVIGITGPPGAGKSTIVNGLIGLLLKEGKKIGIIAVDPTSPFNYGAILGDRLRLSEHFNDESVFIRSLATRGSLGGLTDKIIEVIDVMRSYPFDYIFVETVGVGQSEVEIAGLADTTMVVMTPEAGDEVQTMKAGVMEIADIFIVNKADHTGADSFVKNLKLLSASRHSKEWVIPVLKTVAIENKGFEQLTEAIQSHRRLNPSNPRRLFLLFEKAIRLIQKHRMLNIDKERMMNDLKGQLQVKEFNIYKWIEKYY